MAQLSRLKRAFRYIILNRNDYFCDNLLPDESLDVQLPISTKKFSKSWVLINLATFLKL